MTKKEFNSFIEELHRYVCKYLDVDYKDSLSKDRGRELVQARQITMSICERIFKPTNITLSDIGSFFKTNDTEKGKDHATVLHACKTVSNLIDTDLNFKVKYSELFQKAIKMFDELKNVNLEEEDEEVMADIKLTRNEFNDIANTLKAAIAVINDKKEIQVTRQLNQYLHCIIELNVRIKEKPQSLVGELRYVSNYGVVFKVLDGSERYFRKEQVINCMEV